MMTITMIIIQDTIETTTGVTETGGATMTGIIAAIFRREAS